MGSASHLTWCSSLKVSQQIIYRHLAQHALDAPGVVDTRITREALRLPISLLYRGCKEAALEGVIRVFDRLDAAAEAADREDSAAADGHIPMRRGGRLCASSTEELRLVEGTILLHFNFAMKQDHNLASCLLKGFQRRATAPEVGRAFTPFRVALLLSMARIQRFSQPVLDLVQDIVTDCLVYDHLKEESAWLEAEEDLARGIHRNGGGGGASGGTARSQSDADNGGSDGEGGAAGGGASRSSARVVERVLLTVVRSSQGWDHLVGSLLKLGLQLLDRGGAGAGGGGVPFSAGAAKGVLERLQGSQSQRSSLRASRLGRVVLMETFKTHEVCFHVCYCSGFCFCTHVMRWWSTFYLGVSFATQTRFFGAKATPTCSTQLEDCSSCVLTPSTFLRLTRISFFFPSCFMPYFLSTPLSAVAVLLHGSCYIHTMCYCFLPALDRKGRLQ